MTYDVQSVDEYINALPKDRKDILKELRKIFLTYLPDGFEERYQYNMITYVVPLSRYKEGYLGRKDEPLPFISMASQKNHISLYHMGAYADKELLSWIKEAHKEHTGHKIDMGKSCIRFKPNKEIPYAFVKELATKMDVNYYLSIVKEHSSNKDKQG